ncbi:MAG TPA: hypothetical protein VK612_06015 [Pyrinomonadaceae bacterium]|nr:hypothetical protein [Pyrinomonadaceae bacterium]
MRHQDDEMPEEYQQNAATLAAFLEDRERFRAELKDMPPHLQAKLKAELPKFDRTIDELEALLAKEYERIQTAKAKDAQVTELVDDAWEKSKHIYITIKHQTPHLLDSFTKQVLDPMPEDMLEEFLDGVAILETTKLDTILKGEV